MQIAASLFALAAAQELAGDFNSTVETLSNAEKYWRALGCDNELAHNLTSQGFALMRLGKYHSALTVLEEALSIYKVTGNKYRIYYVLSMEGVVYTYIKKYEIARTILEKVVEIERDMEDCNCLYFGISMGNLAILYLNSGDSAKARSAFEKALQIFQSYNDYYRQTIVLNLLGSNEIFCKNYEVAIMYALSARKIASAIGNEYQMGESFYVQGKAYLGIQNKLEARNCLTEALVIFEKLKVPEATEVRELLQPIE